MNQLVCHFLRSLAVGGSLCCLIISGFPADAAGANNRTPEQAVKAFLETIDSLEFPASDPLRYAELVRQANAYLDVETMGSRALSDHWSAIPGEERQAFIDLLWKLVENVAYPRNQDFIEGEQIVYGKSVEAGSGFQVPVTTKQETDEPAVSMSYHLSEKGGLWKIDDVVLDDVSIIEDLKYQFNKIIAESEFSGLLEKMRERLNKAEEENRGEQK